MAVFTTISALSHNASDSTVDSDGVKNAASAGLRERGGPNESDDDRASHVEGPPLQLEAGHLQELEVDLQSAVHDDRMSNVQCPITSHNLLMLYR
jgi:hypothetical protein